MPDITPTVLTVNADGTTSASFTGRIHAQGLDLDAGSSAAPPAVNRIRWLRTSDGAVVAELFSYEDAGPAGMLTIAQGGVGAGSNVTLGHDDVNPNGNRVNAGAIDLSGTKSANRMVIDCNGNSDYLQTDGSLQKLRVTRGSILFGGNATLNNGAEMTFTLPLAPIPPGTLPLIVYPIVTDGGTIVGGANCNAAFTYNAAVPNCQINVHNSSGVNFLSPWSVQIKWMALY